MTSEKSVLNDILVEVSAMPETIVWRNNTGMAWQGKKLRAVAGQLIEVQPGMVILAEARPIKFGLEGSGDAIGAQAGRPLVIETKSVTGSQREGQRNFERAWTKAGGIYILARNQDDVRKRLDP